MRMFKIYSRQLSNMQYSIINCSHHIVHYIPMTHFIAGRLYLLIPFPILPIPQPNLWQSSVCLCIYELVVFVCLFVCFLDSPCK